MSLREYHDGARRWRDLTGKLTELDVAELERLEGAGGLTVADLLDLARHRVDMYTPDDENGGGEAELLPVCGIPRWVFLSGRDAAVRAFIDRP